jgi:hypothetical protein
MKKTISEEVAICDVCKTNRGTSKCMRCGSDSCYDCEKVHMVTYYHGISVRGYGDGHYCYECDSALRASNDDSLHRAYRTLTAIKSEMDRAYADMRERAEAAEDAVRQEFEKHEAKRKGS